MQRKALNFMLSSLAFFLGLKGSHRRILSRNGALLSVRLSRGQTENLVC